MSTYKFHIPAPPEILRPNGRGSWQAKQRAAKDYNALIGPMINVQLLNARQGGWGPARQGRLIARFVCTREAPDPDNCVAILKPIIDVLQVATLSSGKRYRLGLIQNDRRLELAPIQAVSFAGGVETMIECVLEVWN